MSETQAETQAEIEEDESEEVAQYGEDGFIPTVTKVESTPENNDHLLYHTIDPNKETDIITTEPCEMQTREEYMTDNQQMKLDMM
jgi:hypothetical protein